MKHIYLAAALAAALGAHAQVVTVTPVPLQENSQNVVITFHADEGNRGLAGLTSATAVYAHTGVITNLSDGQWRYAPSWLDNAAKYKLSYAGPDTWKLSIGDIRTYYGITNADEHVEQLAFVFRTADGGREGKTADGGDIYVPVAEPGFQVHFTGDAPFILTEAQPSVTFTAATTEPATIRLFRDDDSEPVATADAATTLRHTIAFTPGTDATLRVEATAGSETKSAELTVCYPGPSPVIELAEAPAMGATANDDGTVTFVVAAPQKTDAMIIGAWNDYRPTTASLMSRATVNDIPYFTVTVPGLDPDTEYPYYFLFDGTQRVGDPYARLVLDPYNDRWLSDGQYPGLIPYPADKVEGNVMLAVYKGTRDVYDWQVTDFQGPRQQDLIIYELLLRDFTGTEGRADGNGTILKALDKLDYLQTLGVNAVELMPIQEFNGNNSWGYNTNFYFAPDKAYGTPDDYRRLIDELHSRGMAVILDVVFNQSDGLHPWYQLYPAGSNPFYNERAPHAYSVLNDWNQDNLLVQQQWTDMLTYWMTAYNVDGFRFDLVKGLGDNESYGGNASEANTNRYNASRIERMRRLTEVVHGINPNAYSINENLAGAEEENAMAANGQLNWANVNEQSAQYAMGWSDNSALNRFYAPNDQRTWGSTVSYAESHDEQRLAYKQDQWAVDGVKGKLAPSMQRLGSVAAQMLLAPGAHMIWQFGELGNATSTKNDDGSNNTDPKPVLWSYYDNAYRHGLYYRQLIDIRNTSPELFTPEAQFSMACAANNWAQGRTIYASTADKELIAVMNPLTTTLTVSGVTFQQPAAEYNIFSKSYQADVTFSPAEGTVTLPGNCYVVIGRGKLSAIDTPVTEPAADLPVSYYNLQGQPLTHPAPGTLVIRRQGTTATKVVM